MILKKFEFDYLNINMTNKMGYPKKNTEAFEW